MNLRLQGVPVLVRLLIATTALGALAHAVMLLWFEGGGTVLDVTYPTAILAGAGSVLVGARRRSEDRGAWLLVAVAMVLWAAAEIVYSTWISKLDPEPYPSIADPMWLAYYPLMIVALGKLVRRRIGSIPSGYWLDVLICVAAAGAIAAVLTTPLIETAAAGSVAQVIVGAAYPIGDFVTLLMVVGVMMVCRNRLSWHWGLLAATQVLFVVADTGYLTNVSGTSTLGSLMTLGWSLGALGLALAPWCGEAPVSPEAHPASWRSLTPPAVCTVIAIVVLAWDHFHRLPGLTILLATATLLMLTRRLITLLRENNQLVELKHAEANTDALTGLGNRRAMLTALERADTTGTQPSVLAIFDLNGFKAYNDTFGHPAGDALLRRLGQRLSTAAGVLGGEAFRPGGDEFCLLVPQDGHAPDDLARTASAALREEGEGFRIDASWGTAVLTPGSGSGEALGLADRAMYAQKAAGRPTDVRQLVDALLAVARERYPDFGDHCRGVADIAEEIARHLGLAPADIEAVRLGAELHDIGKVAIPSRIINKPGPLDEQEWKFMRHHTLIGERVLLAAPDLRNVAPIVRSSHERWDGAGYPDQLAGDAIPLGARIVSACDALDAMISNRPYAGPMSTEDALAEVRRCAGTQFDPAVVDALEAIMAARRDVLAQPVGV
jgi:two-component system, cell cycle response regulator